MLLDATQHYDKPLSDDRLFGWHNVLFPTGPRGKRAAAEQEKETKEQKERRIVIILIAVFAIIAIVVVWHKTNPYTMPIWLQQIIMDVRKFFGDHEYTLYYGSWI